MPAPGFKPRLISVTFDPALFSIHPWATSAYDAWHAAVSTNRLHLIDCLLTREALAIALRATPLPVVQGPVRASRAIYQVVGRFHIYFQLEAYARIDALKPLKATLLCIQRPEGTDWDAKHLEILSQALLFLDSAGRALPIDEYRAIYRNTQLRGWPSLRHPQPSLARMSRSLAISIEQLRHLPTGDPATAVNHSSDDAE